MDLRDLESEVQRLVGFDTFVTGGMTARGPYLDFNGKRRLLKMWIPRSGLDAKKIAELARIYLAGDNEPAFKEMEYKPE